MKDNTVELHTSLGLRDAGRVINTAFARAKANVEPIRSDNPLDGLEGEADVAVVGSRQGLLNQWAVQAYLTKNSSGTDIVLSALGDGAGSRMMSGAKNSMSLSKSTDQMRQIVDALRAEDAQLRTL